MLRRSSLRRSIFLSYTRKKFLKLFSPQSQAKASKVLKDIANIARNFSFYFIGTKNFQQIVS